MTPDTNARLAETAQRVARGELSPGVAAGQHFASYSLSTDRRGIRQFYDAFAVCRSQMQDAAALCGPGAAHEMQSFLAIIAEHIPTQRGFDAAIQRQNGAQQ